MAEGNTRGDRYAERGEAAGLWVSDLDLDKGFISIKRQLLKDSREVGPLKTAKSYRTFEMPREVVEVLRKRGIPVHQVARRLGDSAATLLNVYAHPIEMGDARAGEMLERLGKDERAPRS